MDQGWSNWDLEISRGLWSIAQVRVVTENHSGLRRLLRVYCGVRLSQPARIVLLGYLIIGGLGMLLGIGEMVVAATLVGVVSLLVILYQNFRLSRVMYHAIEIAAQRIGLTPVQTNGKT